MMPPKVHNSLIDKSKEIEVVEIQTEFKSLVFKMIKILISSKRTQINI
jgi:hypothetical protein